MHYVYRSLKNSFAENYDLGSLTAGVKFVDYGSLEFFAERSLQEKKVMGAIL